MNIDPIVASAARGYLGELIDREMRDSKQFNKTENDLWWSGMSERISERLGL